MDRWLAVTLLTFLVLAAAAVGWWLGRDDDVNG